VQQRRRQHQQQQQQQQLVFHMAEERFFPAACALREEGAASRLPLEGSPYTIEAWIMPDADIGHGGIVGWGDWGVHGAVQAFRLVGAVRLKNYWWGNALVADAPTSLADGEYHHVAATWDGHLRKMFVDFKEVARQATTGYGVSRKDNFCVGQTNNHEHFRGRIKDLKIWTNAKTAKEMRWLSLNHKNSAALAFAASGDKSLPTGLYGVDLFTLPPGTELQDHSYRCPRGFERVLGHVYGGDQFSEGYSSSASSIQDCARRCAYTPGCASFEFSSSRKRCFRNSQTRPTHEMDRIGFIFCRRAPCPSLKTEEACVGPSVAAASHSAEVGLRPGSYCIWSGGACQAPLACTDQDCFLPDGGLPGMELPRRYTLWISRAGLEASMTTTAAARTRKTAADTASAGGRPR